MTQVTNIFQILSVTQVTLRSNVQEEQEEEQQQQFLTARALASLVVLFSKT